MHDHRPGEDPVKTRDITEQLRGVKPTRSSRNLERNRAKAKAARASRKRNR